LTHFTRYRAEFPITRRFTYLNHASHGPISLRVKWAVDGFLDLAMNTDHLHDEVSFRKMDECRALLAKMLGCEAGEIGLGYDTSYGLNVAAHGLDLAAGDEVLLSDVEFPANVYPWLGLNRNGIKVRFFKSRGGCADLESIQQGLTRHTKILALSWVQYFNGYRTDLKAISDLCREQGVFFVVDGAQGVGALDLNVKAAGVDFLSSGGAKWLLSPHGSGFFFISKRMLAKLRPCFAGWLGVDWNTDWENLRDYTRKPHLDARKFELGTHPYQDIYGFREALGMLHEIGMKRVEERILELNDRLLGYLLESPYRVKSSLDPGRRSGIVTFTGPRDKVLMQALRREKIVVSYREGGVRVSPHFYNTDEEIDRLIAVLKR
jgi:cysteine desulfurase/selenocysteine lyase